MTSQFGSQHLVPMYFIGITAPGGSLANMYGLMLARHEKFPELKRTGLSALGAPLVVFTSEDSHYSVGKL